MVEEWEYHNYYTPEEDNMIIEAYKNGTVINDLSKTMNRSIRSIYVRALKLGLSGRDNHRNNNGLSKNWSTDQNGWVCQCCNTLLIPEDNWSKTNIKNGTHLCRSCYSKKIVEWRKNHKTESYALAKKWRDGVKAKVFNLMGGKCVRCGFSDPRALQIDHINGMTEQYKTSTFRSGTHLYQVILRGDAPLSDFQLLCANCNWIKKFENHEHHGTNGRYTK